MAHLSTIPPSRTGPGSTAISSTGPSTPQQHLQRHLLSVSPDYCVNMVQYWLGDYAEGRFDLQAADGPFLLDLGDVMYAPNLLTDKHVSDAVQRGGRGACD
jgi:beta-fructofuranosidase